MRWRPKPYQIDAMRHVVANTASGLFLEPGLGKTSITLGAFKALKASGRAKGVLVVAPLRPVYRVWPAEIAKWDDFNDLRFVNLHSLDSRDRSKALAMPGDVFGVNPEGLAWLIPEIVKAKTLPFDVLVIDESTKFKNGQTQRFKLLKQVLHRFSRRIILTGTPSPQSVENLWAQTFILDGGERLGPYVTHFRRQYLDEIHPPGALYTIWVPRPDSADRVRSRIKDICLYMSALDHLKMPERIDNIVKIALPDAVRKIYREVERKFFTDLGAGLITAANAAAAGMKLRQLASGNVYATDGAHAVHDEKLDALSDLVEEQSGKPLLVAVAFTSEVAAIRARLAQDHSLSNVPYLGGGVSAAETGRIEERWNAGKLPVLLAHPSSVAHGLNLQAGGDAIVWYSLTWSLEEYDQFNRRVWRQGQKAKTVVFHHLIAEDTIDEAVLGALGRKDRSQRALLDALKERGLRGELRPEQSQAGRQEASVS